ncbi:hypothetical protein Y032_0076g1062 [Ancylostoma ceylanicum]|uniref:Uncharacterized protein n=1 Tax=Ancylostoma ceylanicum TaxID=53326 RepID=A0A016TUJ8_9BILA|nr:hypothetical protein Y032_0076g1062 [Ancylostoma ceylanicum]
MYETVQTFTIGVVSQTHQWKRNGNQNPGGSSSGGRVEELHTGGRAREAEDGREGLRGMAPTDRLGSICCPSCQCQMRVQKANDIWEQYLRDISCEYFRRTDWSSEGSGTSLSSTRRASLNGSTTAAAEFVITNGSLVGTRGAVVGRFPFLYKVGTQILFYG